MIHPTYLLYKVYITYWAQLSAQLEDTFAD